MQLLSEEDEAAFKQLQWATQALALESEIQSSLFPDFANKPFELLDDYENWYNATKWRKYLPISIVQKEALAAIFDACSKIPDELLSESSMKKDESWIELRKLARKGLDLCGWPSIPPPENRSTYVQ